MLFGVKAGDDDQQQVGPMVATLLGRPCASNVTSFEVDEGVLRCDRDVEGGREVVELDPSGGSDPSRREPSSYGTRRSRGLWPRSGNRSM